MADYDDSCKEWGYFLGAYKFGTKPAVRKAVAEGIEALLAALDQAEEGGLYLRETLRDAASDAFASAICHGDLEHDSICGICGTVVRRHR